MIPGFSPDLTFEDSSLDLLREVMVANQVELYGVTDSWGNYGVHEFGRLAIKQASQFEQYGIFIGHSLGALAALKVVGEMPVRHLVLCSVSALFAEDIANRANPAVEKRIGDKRVQELSKYPVTEAVGIVNNLGIATTIMFGKNEREANPSLVARCTQLANDIVNSELIEVEDAGHVIGFNPYASELARVVSSKY